MTFDEFDATVTEYAKANLDRGMIAMDDVLAHAGIEPDQPGCKSGPITRQMWANRAARALVTAGWESYQQRIGKAMVRRYRPARHEWRCTACGASELTSADMRLHARGIHLR